MTKPNIELRKISHNKSLSEETPAYTAQVWVDGKHYCDVSNHGQGGCDMQHPPKGVPAGPFHADLKALNERIGETFPQWSSEFGDKQTLKRDLEFVCHELLGDIEITKDLRWLVNRTVVFFRPDTNGIHIYKGKHVGDDAIRLIAMTMKKYPQAKILNNLPLDEAIALYKSSAA